LNFNFFSTPDKGGGEAAAAFVEDNLNLPINFGMINWGLMTGK